MSERLKEKAAQAPGGTLAMHSQVRSCDAGTVNSSAPGNILSERTVGFAIARREIGSLNSNPLLKFSNKVTILSIDTDEVVVTLAQSGSLPKKNSDRFADANGRSVRRIGAGE